MCVLRVCGRRHAGLASSASWQRAAEERYDDVKELIDGEKFRFLAWGVGWGQPPAAFRSKPTSLRAHSVNGNTTHICQKLSKVQCFLHSTSSSD